MNSLRARLKGFWKGRQAWWLALVTIAVSVYVAYGNVYENAFLYDDEFLIIKNENLRDWSGIYKSFLMSSTGGSGGADSFYRPIQGVLYTVVFQISGLSAQGYHLLNVTLHALNAIAFFVWACGLGFPVMTSSLAVLLWALHPIHTEAVAYKSATADPLHALFVLLGLIALIKPTPARRIAAGACYLFGLLSKESAIVFPALACAQIFLVSPERRSWRSYLPTWPYWLIAGAYLVGRHLFLDFNRSTFQFYKVSNIYTENLTYRVYTFLASLPSYARVLLWPSDLHMDRNFPVFTSFWLGPVLLGAAIVLLGVVTVSRSWFKGGPLIAAFAALWFFTAHSPHTGVALPVNALFLEHWLYLPSVGLFLLAAHTSLRIRPSVLIFGAGLMLAAGLASLTRTYNEVWETPISFYTHILSYEPKAARIHNNLGMAYSDINKHDLAFEHYRAAIAISDEYPQTHHNLALALLKGGRVEEAKAHFRRALQINPHFVQSQAMLKSLEGL